MTCFCKDGNKIIENQKIEINIRGSKNKNCFLEKGYIPNDNVIITKAEDLPKISNYKIQVKCDFCGDVSLRAYKRVIIEKEHCCKNCIVI